MNDFCNAYNLSSLIKKPTCCKNPDNLSCIDLILTNPPRSFQGSCMVERDLSDIHKLVVTIMKTTFRRLPPKIRTYRNFIDICMRSLEKHAPLIKKYIRGNQLLLMNKELSKAIIHRSKLRNNFLRHRFLENRKKYSKQRNYCVSLLKRIKKSYCNNLNEKNINNKNIMNTFFSNIATSLNIPEYHEYEGISRNISDPILEAIVKYRNYPSIKAIRRVSN